MLKTSLYLQHVACVLWGPSRSGSPPPGPRRELTAHDFAERFDLVQLPRRPIVMNDDDDAWLLDGASDKEST